MHQKHPFHTRKGDDGFNPTRARASKGDDGFRQPGHPVGTARLQHPWAAAGPGRATSGRSTLQTSSNQRDSNRLARTSVTNVVNLSPKTSIFSEKAFGLTTFVTTDQKSTRKTPRIDDVCNNTYRATRQHTQPHWCGGCRRDLPRGLAGLRGVAPNKVRTPSLAGGRALRRLEHPWGHTAAPRSTTRQRVGRLPAPHPSSTPVNTC